jgi:polyisoprenoid-binding protein YceI
MEMTRPNPNPTHPGIQTPAATPARPKWLTWAVVAAVAVVAVVALGAAYLWFSGGSGQPSSAVTAPSLVLEPGDTRTMFHIDTEGSTARFIIHETLLGQPNPVVGETDQVAGEMLVDFDNPANSQLGAVRINIRTLKTDDEIRNRVIRGQVLQSERDEYEFAEFIPTQITNLPDTLTINQPVTFQIAGMLNLHGVTRNVTFDATVTPVDETRLTGTATAEVLYHDFNLSIPEAPGVADISDNVRLEIDFTALAMES